MNVRFRRVLAYGAMALAAGYASSVTRNSLPMPEIQARGPVQEILYAPNDNTVEFSVLTSAGSRNFYCVRSNRQELGDFVETLASTDSVQVRAREGSAAACMRQVRSLEHIADQ